jgi:hypothetical protein
MQTFIPSSYLHPLYHIPNEIRETPSTNHQNWFGSSLASSTTVPAMMNNFPIPYRLPRRLRIIKPPFA